jgi:hypothetical protein
MIVAPQSLRAQASTNLDETRVAPPVLPPMREYDTRYYRVFTDVDDLQVREACLRITRMAEEYHNRTSDFAGQITQRLPFYLFKNSAEYFAAGALPKTDGMFDGSRLMAVGDKGWRTWHTVQHEGFHQFMRSVIGGPLPMWVDEGMAEYFGEAIFTGDGFVSGIIPPRRLARIKSTLALSEQDGGFKSVHEMLDLSRQDWNKQMSLPNYDQAWSMVQFLAHGDNGKYRQPFVQFMGLVSRGSGSRTAFTEIFGDDDTAFEKRWREYWTSLPQSPTSNLYAHATVAILTSYLARSFDQQQRFASFSAFISAAEAGQLKSAPVEWLPPTLLEAVLRDVAVRRQNGEKFDLVLPKGTHFPAITCVTSRGLQVVGSFTLKESQVGKIDVKEIPLPAANSLQSSAEPADAAPSPLR